MRFYLTLVNLSVLFIIFFSISISYAQEISGPVRVQSDSMRYYGNEKKSTFTGNVIAVGDNFTLTADLVNIFFDENNNVISIVSTGNVSFKYEDILAVAKNAELNQVSKTINLKGGAKVWQKENYLEGEHINLKYETREILVEKGSSERVTIIFKPDDNRSKP